MKNGILLWLYVAMAMCWGTASAQVDMAEPADPKPGNQAAWTRLAKPCFVWGTTDVRYSRSQLSEPGVQPDLYAWRGERVNAQAVLATPVDLQSVSFSVSDLRCGKHVIPTDCIKKYFVRYVLTDYYDAVYKDSMLMADWLAPAKPMAVAAQTARPIWLTIEVPHDAAPGRYSGTVTVDADGQELSLPLKLTVAKSTLPTPDKWKFHLDLWQNPYAVARYFDVPLWSDAHFDRMRPMMTALANAGEKVITCSIIRHPWNSQTFDPFESMVVKTKQLDGSWTFNYDVFDRWVEFMMSCGIREQIDCYTIIPWGYTFDYFDVASASIREVHCMPGEQAYEDLMLPFLTDFAKHLKAKGWFDRTCIAMDERPMDQLRAAWKVLRAADPGYRIAGAINYSAELVSMMYDISLIYSHANLPAEVLLERRATQQCTTFYTCCAPARPNTFTFSPAAESAFIGWHVAALGYDGYLRWAYNSWTENPTLDSRYPAKNWYSGDCYLMYPEGSSIRWERLVEGIQACEKINLLREAGVPEAKLQALLAPFADKEYPEGLDAAKVIGQAQKMLRKLERP